MSVNRKVKKYGGEETDADRLRAKKEEIRKKVGKPYLKIVPKTENQDKFIKDILDKDSMYVIATGIAGCGKAQPLTSKVLTINGWKLFKDITLSDIVITPDNKTSEIIGIYPQGIKDIYEITFEDGRKVECCKEHLWKVFEYNKNVKHKENYDGYKILSLEEIIKKENRLKAGRLYISLVEPISLLTNEIELPIDPYLFGILIGDGCLGHNRVSFSSADDFIIEKIKNIVNDKLHIITKRNKYDYTIIKNKELLKHNDSNYFMDKIRELKLDVNSDKKFIPEIYKNLSLNNKKELLKGLFDSDGTIGKNGNISYSTVSKQLAIDIQDILWSMGCICKIVETQKFYKDKNGDKKAGKLCYRLNVRTDKHSDLFHSPRKLERIPLNYQYNNLKLRIKEINLKSSEEAVCISIKDENKLYITDNYIVTHNTFIALVQAINLLLSHDNEYTKIRIFKPLKQLQNEDIGILPGGVEEKLEYVLMSYSMQLNKLLSPIALEILFKEKIIEIIPMGNLRGLSLDNINIFDEFQNVSVDNAETVLTRLEEDAKMIIIGDIRQRDFKDKKDNGLMFLSEHFKDFDDHVKIIEFVDSDCVRSPLIQKITKLFDEKKPI